MVGVHALIATGVNADGHREILGLDVASAEDDAGWLAFLRGLVARGLSGVQLVISNARPSLVAAIGFALPGASWQRCRTRYLRNLLTKVPRSTQPHVATQVRTIFDQADAAAVHAQYDRVVEALEAAKYREAAEHLGAAGHELLAFTAYPREIWRQIWSNNPQERLNKEIRRTDVVSIFPAATRWTAWSAPCSPNRTTNGPKAAATWAWNCSANPASASSPRNRPHCRRAGRDNGSTDRLKSVTRSRGDDLIHHVR
jgi:transposase-like protein